MTVISISKLIYLYYVTMDLYYVEMEITESFGPSYIFSEWGRQMCDTFVNFLLSNENI